MTPPLVNYAIQAIQSIIMFSQIKNKLSFACLGIFFNLALKIRAKMKEQYHKFQTSTSDKEHKLSVYLL